MSESIATEKLPRSVRIALSLIAASMTMCLLAMGRVWWCQAGDLSPWSWDVWSNHNSQHLVDPYSLSHIEHGLWLFLLLKALRVKWLTTARTILMVAIVEAIWEVSENTPMMIERYREATISLDYFGDSILNSISDYAMCLAGLAIARRIPGWASLALIGLLECVSVVWIRDGLLLNILMLLWPVDAIREWQSAAQPQITVFEVGIFPFL